MSGAALVLYQINGSIRLVSALGPIASWQKCKRRKTARKRYAPAVVDHSRGGANGRMSGLRYAIAHSAAKGSGNSLLLILVRKYDRFVL